MEDAFFSLRKFMKINCRHRADYESDAMWKLYAEQSKGERVIALYGVDSARGLSSRGAEHQLDCPARLIP